ncbi:MAG TPA: class I SAM-dependent methyltransferase [Mycobacteriales bacterium]|jgi:SAM-dependent methyltransferase|nr:class I SAM-dependent methyltransferase [Mycobacteriales bacterium]
MPAPLVLTGERTLPGIADENYWFRRHEAAYRALTAWVAGAQVLEAGCGEGYGADLLARSGAGVVTGLDYDPATVAHAAATYPNVAFLRGDLQRMPFAAGSFEVVVHLQTIEHLHDQPGFLAGCAHILRPAGTLAISTPNRLTFSPGRSSPLNPFHTRELSAAELTELLLPGFEPTRLLGVHHGPRLNRLQRRVGPLIAGQQQGPPESWPEALRSAVYRVRANDFVIREDCARWPLAASLDLLAIGYRRPRL